MVSVVYVLTLGGTYHSLTNLALQRVALGLLTLGVVVWLVLIWRRPPRRVFLLPVIGLWVAAYAIAMIAHPSGRGYIGGWYAGLYAGVWLVLSDLRQRGLPGRWLIDAALFAAIPLMILAFMQVATWYPAWLALEIEVAFVPPRPPSVLGNPNVFGSFLAVLLPLGVVRVRWARRRADRLLWGVWVAAALLMLYITFSRGAWLATGAASVTLGGLTVYRLDPMHWWRRQSRRVRRGLGLIAVGGGLLMLAALVASLSVFDTPRRDTSDRLKFYDAALDTFAAHPFTGTGPFTFGLSLLEDLSIPPNQPHAHAHNLPLNVAAELGLPGLLALGATAVVLARRGWRQLRAAANGAEWADRAACLAALVGLGAHCLVDMPVMVPMMILLAIGIVAAGYVPGDVPRAERRGVGYRVLSLMLWGGLLATGWWSAQVYADYVRGERLLVEREYSHAEAVLRDVAERHSSLALYHAEYGYACGLAAAAGDETLLEPGIAAYNRALELEAPHAVWWANLAALYWQAGEDTATIDAMQQAVHYAPDAADMWFGLGVYYEETAQTDRARAAYRRVLTLEGDWAMADFWAETALRHSVLVATPVEPGPYQQAWALWEAGQYDRARDVLQRWIDHDPTQPGPYIQLARMYLSIGKSERADAYLEAAELLVHTYLGQAWLEYARAEFASQAGDTRLASDRLQAARDAILPDKTGQAIYHGLEIAHFQFLRLSVPGSLLPQVETLGPDPALLQLLDDPAWTFSG